MLPFKLEYNFEMFHKENRRFSAIFLTDFLYQIRGININKCLEIYKIMFIIISNHSSFYKNEKSELSFLFLRSRRHINIIVTKYNSIIWSIQLSILYTKKNLMTRIT